MKVCRTRSGRLAVLYAPLAVLALWSDFSLLLPLLIAALIVEAEPWRA